jgi:hypothetical protein
MSLFVLAARFRTLEIGSRFSRNAQCCLLIIRLC